MQFLFNPLSWLTDAILAPIGGAIVNGLRHLFFLIDSFIYGLIIDLYNMFESLCYGRFLDGSIMEKFAQRIGLILGIVMLFSVILSFIKILIDPDSNKGENSVANIIKKIIMVIVMLGMSSFVFEALYHVQYTVVKSNIIGKVLLPFSVDTGVNEETGNSNFGAILSEELFYAFYHIENIEGDFSSDAATTVERCTSIESKFRNNIIKNRDFDLGTLCLTEALTVTNDGEKFEKHVMHYNFLLATIVGGIVVYFIFSYCISVGVRMVQLMFLEIISPMAIISNLSPKKDTMFSKWSKIYISTYIDVFIRIAIINFVVFLISIVFSETGQEGFILFKTINLAGANTATKFFYKVFLVLALMVFAKKVPDLLKDLFPSSGGSKLGFGISSPKKLFDSMFGLKEIGRVSGAATTGLIGAGLSGISRYNANRVLGKSFGTSLGAGVLGGVTGLGRGILAGGKSGNLLKNISTGVTNQRKFDNDYTTLVSSGGSTPGRFISRATDLFTETKGQRYRRQLADLDKLEEFKKSMQSAADEVSYVKSAKDTWEQMTQNAGEEDTAYEKRKQDAYVRYKTLRNATIDAALNGRTDIHSSYGNFSMDDNDKIYSSDINSIVTQASSYSTSHNVQYWDESSKTYKYVGTIASRDDLANAADMAHITKTHITGSSDYHAALANDQAAGVSNRRTGGGKNS